MMDESRASLLRIGQRNFEERKQIHERSNPDGGDKAIDLVAEGGSEVK